MLGYGTSFDVLFFLEAASRIDPRTTGGNVLGRREVCLTIFRYPTVKRYLFIYFISFNKSARVYLRIIFMILILK